MICESILVDMILPFKREIINGRVLRYKKRPNEINHKTASNGIFLDSVLISHKKLNKIIDSVFFF